MHKFGIALLALALGACASVQLPVAGPTADYTLPNAQGRTATFQYLGTGGWVIRRGDDVVLTAPFFTNPGFLRIPFGGLHPNRRIIEEQLQRVPADDLARVNVIVAGHAHYDHIMDLPVVFEHVPASAPLVGGPTVCNTLQSALHGRVCQPVTQYAGTRNAAGTAYTAGNINIRPYFSQHAAHFEHIKFMNGHYAEPLAHVPTHILGWREGEPLAYLIDFMNGSDVALRVYYQDSAANAPYGLPDDATLREHPIDVAILCVASYQQVETHPEAILALGPKYLLLGHWENFFTSARKHGRPVAFTDVPGFLARVGSAAYTLPDRGTRITITY
ncbi:MAG: hypothetical protein QOH21_883 [Acidobacteriota bacterium]|jgi:L-ascorbate metabolism protein UlaG (beta-lactamase superfamily)|nr:hypothetical protein [Acidobacteriota bacterium]